MEQMHARTPLREAAWHNRDYAHNSQPVDQPIASVMSGDSNDAKYLYYDFTVL